jgi:hypothetical protein
MPPLIVDVLGVSRPPDIAECVVFETVAVAVRYFMRGAWLWSEKRLSHQDVNRAMVSLAESRIPISFRRNPLAKDAPGAQIANPTQRGNLITWAINHRAPLLLLCHVNSIGCPSAAGQLATGWSPVFFVAVQLLSEDPQNHVHHRGNTSGHGDKKRHVQIALARFTLHLRARFPQSTQVCFHAF